MVFDILHYTCDAPNASSICTGRFHYMNRFLHLRLSVVLRKYATACLAYSWILGLISGLWVVHYADLSLPEIENSFRYYTPVSIFSIALLPVLISALVVFAEQFWLLLPISFLKAFSFAYVSALVIGSYGPASWLVQLLLVFSDCISLPFLWLFWCRMLKSTHRITFSMVLPITLVAFSIGVLDFKVISPFFFFF